MQRQTNMKDFLVQLNDLPDEILMHIFQKLHHVEVLYSLTGVNQRLNRIVHDPCFTRHLSLLQYSPDGDSTFPLADPILDRFYSTILPEIGHQVETLDLERTSAERILHATNYCNLHNLSLHDIDLEKSRCLFKSENPLTHIFKDQISSLYISFNDEYISLSWKNYYQDILTKILTIFTNLRCLKFNPLSFLVESVRFDTLSRTVSSTLLELHISVPFMEDCFYILDGRFDQLRVLHVRVFEILFGSLTNKHEVKLLPNLQVFSLSCKKTMYGFDKLSVLVLRRMINLEELDLNIDVNCYRNFIDGDSLRKNILSYMPRLYKFTFSIFSLIDYRYQTNLPSKEDIQKTFKSICTSPIITCVDHFKKERLSQCHVYSYPYRMSFYNDITNNFPGGLFKNVTEVSLRDERPFECEFFLQISQSFPFMKELTIINRKEQNDKQLTNLSRIEYPNLSRLYLDEIHDDYVDLFLFDPKISLPNNFRLSVDYQSLERVTYNFTRSKAENNCNKIGCLHLYDKIRADQYVEDYFPKISISCIGLYRWFQ